MRISKLFIIVLFGFVIGFSSCKKEGPTTFTLQLKAKYGNQNFEMNSTNTDPAGRYVSLSTLKFYLSHINLIKSDGSTVNVASVAIFDFSDTANLTSVSVKNIQGSFTGISFACGLDSLTNDTTNALNYSLPNPFSYTYNMYWPMIDYQFEILEGKWDDQDTSFLHNGLLYHIGTNAAYRQTQLNKSFSVSGNPYTMTVYLDVEQIFNNTPTGETINLVTQPSSMSTDYPAVMTIFVDNFSKSFSIE
jgi:hypothetical protein